MGILQLAETALQFRQNSYILVGPHI